MYAADPMTPDEGDETMTRTTLTMVLALLLLTAAGAQAGQFIPASENAVPGQYFVVFHDSGIGATHLKRGTHYRGLRRVTSTFARRS